MPLCTLVEKDLLGLELGATAYTPPANYWVGLISVTGLWAATHAYTLGQYVVPTAFNSGSGSVGRIFVCTTAGTSAGTEPTWPATAGGAVTDGTAHWTEVSALFAAGTFTGAEPSGGAYARVEVANNVTNFPAPSGGNPAQVQNGTAVTYPTTTATWGDIAGFFLADASTAGNFHQWGVLSALATGPASVGVTPSFAVAALTATLL